MLISLPGHPSQVEPNASLTVCVTFYIYLLFHNLYIAHCK